MGSSLQTHLLSYWVRERGAFTLEQAVRMLTIDNAAAWELPDRGLVRTGFKADLVLFDEAGIRPRLPTVETDLPDGAHRLVQKADGIAAIVVNGEVTMRDGEATGRHPSEVLKGPLAERRGVPLGGQLVRRLASPAPAEPRGAARAAGAAR